MSDLDPQREWKRISKRYRALSDEELVRIAQDSNVLTDIALQALATELRVRGLRNPANSSDPTPNSAAIDSPQNLVEVGRFRFLSEGSLAKAAIESAGIKTFLFDETMSKYVALGVRICVKEEDSEAAKEILSQPIPSSFEVEGVGTYEQPRCPNCNSLDISFGPAIYEGMVDRDLLPDEQWWCHSCNSRWSEESEA